MLKDFYYSSKMQHASDSSIDCSANRPTFKRHTVNIHGKELPFTLQVDHGKENIANWEDMVFLGTADDSNITYNFI